MKKYSMLIAASLMVLFSAMPSAFATPVNVGDLVQFDPGNVQAAGGGEFLVNDESNIFLFGTFCLEKDEFIDYTNKFAVHDISFNAIDGGVGGPSPDPISDATAWLYLQYVNGGYGSIVVDGDTYDEANIQEAIWLLEEETNSAAAKSMTLKGLAEIKSAGFVNNIVRVMNLKWTVNSGTPGTPSYRAIGDLAQSMLLVPEPSTMLFLGLGMVGLGFLTRRKLRNG